jgi:hypothetical protein
MTWLAWLARYTEWWSSKAIHVFAKGLLRKLAHFLHAVHEHIIMDTATSI